jgi:serine/threonine-protein kinase HipA
MDPKLLKQMFGVPNIPIISFSLQDVPLKAQEMVGKMSISGMQPKLSVKLDKKSGELVLSPTEGEYILKPQTQQFPHTPENENCCMDIGGSLGIQTPLHCLLPLKDQSLAYVVKRFDRIANEKIHQENFYQILEIKEKYTGSVEQIGKKLKEISVVPGLDVQLFFERVVFNFLIGNGDAHFKNTSVSYGKDGIRLSPAYDILCSKLIIPNENDSALSIHGKKNDLTREDFDALAEYFKIPPRIRFEKFEKQAHRIQQEIQSSRLPDDFKRRFVDIVLSRYERLRIAP